MVIPLFAACEVGMPDTTYRNVQLALRAIAKQTVSLLSSSAP